MTGLEKMKSRIMEEARALADRKVEAAGRQARELLEQAEEEAAKRASDISRKAEKEAEHVRERTASSMDLLRRRRILAAKQEMIGEILSMARASVKEMEADEYFALLLNLACKYALPKEGVIYFSPEDLKRMPEGFGAEIGKAAEEKGGRLAVSEKGRNPGGGFVLDYGGVEENCTWEVIFEAKREELTDLVSQILFGQAGKEERA